MEQCSTDESVASIDIDKSLAGCDIGSSVSHSGVKSNPHSASTDEANIIREARRIKRDLLARIGEVSASTDISGMRHKILNLEGDVENFYQFLKENVAHTAAEDLGDRVGLEFKTLKQKIWDKIGSEEKEFGADVGPEDSVSNAGSSFTVSSEAALAEIDLTLQREELRLKAQQADLEAQQRQTEFALLDAKLRAEQKKQAILSGSCSSSRAGSRVSKASSAKSHLPQAVRGQQQRVKQMPVCRDLGASGPPKLFSTPPGFHTKLCLDRDEGELGPPRLPLLQKWRDKCRAYRTKIVFSSTKIVRLS